MKIAEYFIDDELECKCGCGKWPDFRFIERLYAMRLILGHPLVISSGARCVPHNRNEGGKSSSAHLIGAADIISYSPEEEGQIIRVAMDVGMTGIGFHDNKLIHVDDKRLRLTFWGYK